MAERLTRREEKCMAQVIGGIYDRLPFCTLEDVQDIDDCDGWTFDIRFGDEGPNSWTRVEGYHLGYLIDFAYERAEAWMRGEMTGPESYNHFNALIDAWSAKQKAGVP